MKQIYDHINGGAGFDVDTTQEDGVEFFAEQGCDNVRAMLDRDAVQRLNDQLSEWLSR